MQEQRLSVRLIKYWDTIRKTDPLPDIKKFNSAVVEDLWPYCTRVLVSGVEHPTYKYEYMGKPVVGLYGADLTGTMVDHRVMEFPGSVIHKMFDSVITSKNKLIDEGHVHTKTGQLIKFRACFLPFGNEHQGVTHIITGLSCRIF